MFLGAIIGAVLGSTIAGGLSLIGVIYASNKSANKVQTQLAVAQAITDTKITELTREVREHNNFAKRVPVLEEKIEVANHRIEDLENKE